MKMKFEISYSRTVQPAPYESLRIEYRKEFDVDELPPETALKEVSIFIKESIKAELEDLTKEREAFRKAQTLKKAIRYCRDCNANTMHEGYVCLKH